MTKKTGLLLRTRIRRDRRGSVIVEAAMVLPMVMVLLCGLVEMGRALQHQHTLTESVREAARYLARVPLACPAGGDPNWATARSNAQHLAATGRVSGGQPLVTGWTDASFTIADPVCETWSGRAVQLITVSANVPYGDLGLLQVLGLDAVRLGASHQQVHIGE
ncbi:MAG TPA: TadE family protein [Azospirillum sp.]|nr:TadE family protein [Azospirillum sp.]